jgi:tetratricopeptide (TPR) repeat protein
LFAGALLAFGAPAAVGADQADNAVPAVVPHCGAGAAPSAGGAATKTPVMLPGFGTGGFKVRTSAPDAQAWFDYGMKLAHAFNHEPATDAFVEASRRDPTCAMCVWGEAWSRGPTINFDIEPDAKKRAAELAAKAVVLAEGGPEKERLLAAALVKRYDPALGKDAYVAFAQAMDGVAARFPTDNEIAVITADAWMIARWGDRNAQNRAMALLTEVLKRDPNDTGAIHFYIHVTEAAGVPQYALPFARRLGELAPAAAHLVHMPSHTFIHVGLYQLATDVNAKASDEDKAFIAQTGQGKLWIDSYHAHNVMFGLGGAMLAGDGGQSLTFADELGDLAKSLDDKQSWPQISVGPRYFAYGRWAAPDKVLALPEPDAKQGYLRAMWRYARGEALARKGDAVGVLAEAKAIEQVDLSSLKESRDYGERLVAIAKDVLRGRAALLQGRWDAAADAFRRGAEIQEARFARSWDPPAWWYPVRRSLAEAELRAGRLDAAEADARTVLKTWRDDPVSEWVLAGVEAARGQTADADALRTKARGEWRGDLSAIKPADV